MSMLLDLYSSSAGRKWLDVVPKELLSSDLNSNAPTAAVLVGHISISTISLNLWCN